MGGSAVTCNEKRTLVNGCPEPLKEIVKMCDTRLVLFDNKTKDPKKKADQLKHLLSLVNRVLEKNGGVPYTSELSKELKALKVNSLIDDLKHVINELKEPIPRSYEEQLTRLTESLMTKLMEIMHKLLTQLDNERADRVAAEQKAKEAQAKLEGEMHELRKRLERSQQETKSTGCRIL